jgi:hypothetical protein
MTTLFLIVSGLSLAFFLVFLVGCSRPRRAVNRHRNVRPTVIRKVEPQPLIRRVESRPVDSLAGRRFLIHLEHQMAEFLAMHGRSAAILLVAVLVIPGMLRAQPQAGASARQQTSASDQDIPPAVAQQLEATQKRIEQLEQQLNDRKASGADEAPTMPAHSTVDQESPSSTGSVERSLHQLPPINGATAFSGTPYFTQNPRDPFKAWDTSATFDYMPSQYITFRFEYDHRAANVPYFSGPGGITPPGGNTGSPGSVVPGFTPFG